MQKQSWAWKLSVGNWKTVLWWHAYGDGIYKFVNNAKKALKHTYQLPGWAICRRFDGIFDWNSARLIDGILDWKRGCLENSELKNIAFTAIRRPNSWISDVNWIDEMQEYTKLIARWMLPTFGGVSARWNICLYPENLPRNRPKVWRKSTRRWAC